MPHCDPETLALRSLGEGVGTPEDDAHLATCQGCQSELASLGELVGTARSGGRVELALPSPEVWNRIRSDLGLESQHGQAVPPRPATTPAVPEQPRPLPVPASDLPPETAPVVSLQDRRERRSRPATWLLAAAGIGGIVVGGAITASIVGSSQESQEDLTVAATVELAPLPDWDAQGTAELAVGADGQQVLVVSLDGATDTTGFQEVWLIDENVEGMFSLGILDGTSGQFVIPDGVDVSAFPIVDISLEPFDGDPTHSGDSIARGQIEV